MKQKRQTRILELIVEFEIETQEELADRLRENGFRVTQATVSRDIRELGLTKHSAGKGRQKYVAMNQSSVYSSDKFGRMLKEGLVSIETAQNILVIKTVSGMAMAVAAAVDALHFQEIVGCIAGDDTIMAAVRSAEDALVLKNKMEDMLK